MKELLMSKKIKSIKDIDFCAKDHELLGNNSEIERINVTRFNIWLSGFLSDTLTDDIKNIFSDGLREFSEGFCSELKQLLDTIYVSNKVELNAQNEGISADCQNILVTKRFKNTLCPGIPSFEYVEKLFKALATCFNGKERSVYNLTEDEEREFCPWIPCRRAVGDLDVYFLEHPDNGTVIIAYVAPHMTAGQSFSWLVEEALQYIDPITAYPLEIPVDQAAVLLGYSLAKTNALLDKRSIPSNENHFGKNIYLHDLMEYIKEEFGEEDERLLSLNNLAKSMVDGEVEKFKSTYGKCIDSNEEYPSYGVTKNQISSLYRKLKEYEEKFASMEKIPSVNKGKPTLTACIKFLFSKYKDCITGTDSSRLSENKYFEAVKGMVGDECFHASLAEIILSCYPSECRRKRGRISNKNISVQDE